MTSNLEKNDKSDNREHWIAEFVNFQLMWKRGKAFCFKKNIPSQDIDEIISSALEHFLYDEYPENFTDSEDDYWRFYFFRLRHAATRYFRSLKQQANIQSIEEESKVLSATDFCGSIESGSIGLRLTGRNDPEQNVRNQEFKTQVGKALFACCEQLSVSLKRVFEISLFNSDLTLSELARLMDKIDSVGQELFKSSL